MQTVTSITAEGVEWQWKSFDRAAAIARAVPELKRMHVWHVSPPKSLAGT